MKKTPVIIDMNLTEEFASGFMSLLQNQGIDILGITLCFGRTDLETARDNTAGLLELLGRDIPVAMGATAPIMGDYTVPMHNLSLCSHINGLQLDTKHKVTILPTQAHDYMYDTAKAFGEPVTIVCAGPMTNIALMLHAHPDAVKYIDKIVWCGGTSRIAELEIVKDMNTYMDADAAGLVLSYGIDFVVCPTDIGEKFYATKQEIDTAIHNTNEVTHQKNRLYAKRWNDMHSSKPIFKRVGDLPLQDLAAALYITNPELFTTQRYMAEVDRKGRLTKGMFVLHVWNYEPRHGDEPNVTVLVDADREKAISYLY